MLWVCPVLGQQVASLCSDWCTCLRVVLRGDRGGGRVTSGAAGPCRETLAQVPLQQHREEQIRELWSASSMISMNNQCHQQCVNYIITFKC